MKRLILPLAASFILASCGKNDNKEFKQSSITNTEIMEKEETQKIEELLNEYKASLNTSNAQLAQSLYTENGVFMPSEAPSGIGSENILKSYEFVFSQIQLNIEFFIDEIVIDGSLAYAVTNSKGTVKILASETVVPEANRELFVFEKVNGSWKIARYMFNKTEPKK